MAVVTTGFFDGVHLGHRHVLETVVSSARERGEEATVVTFWPHPRTVLQQDARDLRLLSTLEEKKALLAACGIDRVEVLPFTREFAAMTAAEYLQLLADKYAASQIVMGYDNRIGSDMKTASEICVSPAVGCADPSHPSDGPLPLTWPRVATGRRDTYLNGLSVIVLEECHSERSEESISSTQIRKSLAIGDVEAANSMLGYRYGLDGVVVAGNRMGRTIGFPTANMQLYEPLKMVPGNGVYEVEVQVLGGMFKGMCNIGVRPTVDGKARTIETHILNFDEDIYGLPVGLRFVRRIRDERKFGSVQELREQLLLDKEQIEIL